MIKKYGASRDLTFKFHSLMEGQREINNDNNDSDKLIEDNNIMSK